MATAIAELKPVALDLIRGHNTDYIRECFGRLFERALRVLSKDPEYWSEADINDVAALQDDLPPELHQQDRSLDIPAHVSTQFDDLAAIVARLLGDRLADGATVDLDKDMMRELERAQGIVKSLLLDPTTQAAADELARIDESLGRALYNGHTDIGRLSSNASIAMSIIGETFRRAGRAMLLVAGKRADLLPARRAFLDDPQGPEMVVIPAGTFTMGGTREEHRRFGVSDQDASREMPQTEIVFREKFALARYATALDEYDAFCVQTSRKQAEDAGWGRGRRPAIFVSWQDATAYADWLSARTGAAYRLPSEAEWEYACRAGTETAFSHGETITTDQVNFVSDRDGAEQTGENRMQSVPVDHPGFRPNGFGLWQMHGNVWEWCADFWHGSHEGANVNGLPRPVPQQDPGAAGRVIRGGSWSSGARRVRAAYRHRRPPGDRDSNDLGFRCARGLVSQAGTAPEVRSGSAAGAGAAEPSHGPAAAPAVAKPEPWRADIEPLLISEHGTEWLSGGGQDQYGLWCAFDIEGVTQRMRWCPPGRFLMGSPEEEVGRLHNEGPQTEITFRSGFWMFDTAVPQKLWTAVMSENPSQFNGPDLPVERVSWIDANDFTEQLNAVLPGLSVRLPSEAEWEYACRAGTVTPYAFGDKADPDQIHFESMRTVDVAEKPPNAWGHHHMHGNVWEWCFDIWSESHNGSDASGLPRQASPAGPEGHSRVVRGGSWSAYARDVRSACRRGRLPVVRDGGFGFRCARGQAG